MPRTGKRISISGPVAILSLVVQFLFLLPRPAGAQATVVSGPPVAEANGTAQAMAAARAQNSPVVVADLTTEDRMVRAQPDGTLVAELSPGIVRVRQDKGWVGVDTTLERRADGTVAPRAVSVDLALSGGGSEKPLVRYGRAGKWLALSWPGTLPEPVLSGNTATYTEVFPGVDLVMRANADGYAQYLVIKTADAAKHPDVASVRLGMRTSGLTVRADAKGALKAKDAEGEVVFEAPPSLMWDSAERGDPGAKRAVAAVAVDERSLTWEPDKKLLADPATRFPVTVDPLWGTPTRMAWAKVFDGALKDDEYWNGGEDGGEAKVGRCYNREGRCYAVGIARSYFQYDTTFLRGTDILEATLNTTITHGPSCYSREHGVYLASGRIYPTTNWTNKPEGSLVTALSVGSVYADCPGYKPVGFRVKDGIRTDDVSTYFIKATDENDDLAWRKYDPGTTNLVVRYNRMPNAPYMLTTAPPLDAPCRWCAGLPYVGDATITLKGRLSDPDNEQIRPIWDIYYSGARDYRDWGPTQGSDSSFSTDVDLTGHHGKTVSWLLKANDGEREGPSISGPPFAVDQQGVTVRPGVTGTLYRDDNRWHGGAGVPGNFTFDSAGVADIDHFVYGWNDPPNLSVDADALGGKATVSIPPPGDGPQDLRVQSVDRAGHHSPMVTYHIYVRAGNGPYAKWPLEGNAEDKAFLGTRNGTLNGSVTYAKGAVGDGLAFEQSTTPGAMTAANGVRTDASFSVSAWVKLDTSATTTVARAAVSQDGANFGGFVLWYRPENGGRWVFGMSRSGDTYKGTDMASSTTAQLGVWTHLAGVYDLDTKQLKLYVNGEPAGTATRTGTPWHAGGSFRVGQARWSGALADSWIGGVDEVQLYDRPLSAAEVQAAVSADNVHLGHWPLDEKDGTTAGNTVPGGQSAVLSTGAAFTADPQRGQVVALDGTRGHLSTHGQVLSIGQSFTVAAWVKAKQVDGPQVDGPRVVLSQDGNRTSGLQLQAEGGRWAFAMFGADVDGGGQVDRVQGPADAPDGRVQPEVWTHLSGVYDAQNQQIKLYVNGTLMGTLPHKQAWDAAGPFTIGRGKSNGTPANFWLGSVDSVRVYSRALPVAEIQGLVSMDNVSVGQWKLDGDVLDSSGNARHGTVDGKVAWAAGQTTYPQPHDLALQLDGARPNGVSAGHALNAMQSFSVTAWVRADKSGIDQAVASQDGSFLLGATSSGAWGFVMYNTVTGGTQGRVTGGAIKTGAWAHLVGVYDAGAKRMALYVNGALVASGDHAQTADLADGRLRLGYWQNGSSAEGHFAGAMDDVAVYSRQLFSEEIKVMSGRDLSLVHQWRFDEPGGDEAGDAVGAKHGTLAGGAGYTAGRVGNAVQLDGVNDSVSTDGVDVRTDDSFTVTAWVRLPSSAADNCDLSDPPYSCRATAVSVDGDRSSKFRLGFLKDDDQNSAGAWIFELPEEDKDNAPVTKAAVSAITSDFDSWVHLTGVYDRPGRSLVLYVNGARQGEGTLLNPWKPVGGVQIGRGKVDGAETEFWPGRVDDVRLYTGAHDKARVKTLHASYPPIQGPATLPADAVGHWMLDEGTGTTAGDSRSGATATLHGGAAWTGGRGGNGLWLDGTSGYAQTNGLELGTGASFSATAWAYVAAPGSGQLKRGTIVAQDGARTSSFALTYDQAAGVWAAELAAEDDDDPPTVLKSVEPALHGRWTHLAIVYEAPLRQVRFYVNGVMSAVQVGVSIFKANGPLTIGRALRKGVPTDFFGRGIDDVRVFGRALSDGEVRRVHDDVPAVAWAHYTFDDSTANDSSWRKAHATLSGGTSFVAGKVGLALQLNGSSGSAATSTLGIGMEDSFTVSAWARLDSTAKTATVVGQDGARMSAFALQYRAGLERWVFGGYTHDADGAEMVYARSATAPVADRWTHLTGVYDYATRQLRLYVGGKLAGVKDDVALWTAVRVLSIGRAKVNGQPADYFPGALDEVRVEKGIVSDAEIAERAAA